MAFTFLYVTAKDGPEARKIAQHLLEKRLIACANIFPVSSLYRWEGKIYIDGEHLCYEMALGSVLKIKSGTLLNVVGDLQKKRKE